MKIVVNGTQGFKDYQVFLRAMRVVLSDMNNKGDKDLVVYSAGPSNINSFAKEFFNITERSLKTIGVKAKIVNRPLSEIQNILGDIDYLAFFCLPGEGKNKLVSDAEALDTEVGIFRF